VLGHFGAANSAEKDLLAYLLSTGETPAVAECRLPKDRGESRYDALVSDPTGCSAGASGDFDPVR
jgi:hypothetical protein